MTDKDNIDHGTLQLHWAGWHFGLCIARISKMPTLRFAAPSIDQVRTCYQSQDRKALRIDFPRTLVGIADEVIEQRGNFRFWHEADFRAMSIICPLTRPKRTY
jgi:hypothetical protein